MHIPGKVLGVSCHLTLSLRGRQASTDCVAARFAGDDDDKEEEDKLYATLKDGFVCVD